MVQIVRNARKLDPLGPIELLVTNLVVFDHILNVSADLVRCIDSLAHHKVQVLLRIKVEVKR